MIFCLGLHEALDVILFKCLRRPGCAADKVLRSVWNTYLLFRNGHNRERKGNSVSRILFLYISVSMLALDFPTQHLDDRFSEYLTICAERCLIQVINSLLWSLFKLFSLWRGHLGCHVRRKLLRQYLRYEGESNISRTFVPRLLIESLPDWHSIENWCTTSGNPIGAVVSFHIFLNTTMNK